MEIQEYEWETVAGIIEVLTPVEEVTTEFSSQFYPSLSRLIPIIKISMTRLAAIVSVEYNPWILNLLNGLKGAMGDDPLKWWRHRTAE